MSSVLQRVTAEPTCGLRSLVLSLGIFLVFGTTQVRAQRAVDTLFQQTENGGWVQTARVSFSLDRKHIYDETVSDASASERFLDSLSHALEQRPGMEVRRSRQGPRMEAAELVEGQVDTPSRGLESADRAVFQYRFKIEPGAFVEQIESIQFYEDSRAPTDSSRDGEPVLYLETSEEWMQDLLGACIPVQDLAPAEQYSSLFQFARLNSYGRRILTIGGQNVTGDSGKKKRRTFVRLVSQLGYESE